MPLKLIGTIILLIAVTIFCGFNLDNKCNISFVFYTFENVSVFITVMVSFFAGILVMTPFALFKKKMTREEITQASQKIKAEDEKRSAKEAKKAEQEKLAAEKLEAKNKAAAERTASREEERTVFDFKIRTPGAKKVSKENTVPKAAKPEETGSK
jgi:uncharacterized integral membrane protein